MFVLNVDMNMWLYTENKTDKDYVALVLENPLNKKY